MEKSTIIGILAGVLISLLFRLLLGIKKESIKTNEILEQIRDDQRTTGRHLIDALKDINSNTSIG